MKAKEMFEELGYEIQCISEAQIIYNRESCVGSVKQIIINNLPKANRGIYINYNVENQGAYIYFEEVQAIKKQVEELGW